jgi:predicted dehydrogenase
MKKDWKILVIGYGSIGKRHAQVLNQLYPSAKIAIISTHREEGRFGFSSLSEAGNLHDYDYFIIASQTSSHYDQLALIDAEVSGKIILVEKPLFHEFRPYFTNRNKIFIGYNLRFHPLINILLQLSKQYSFISVNACVGQYLPQWRPDDDYRRSYSASIERGGGVLLDLSHELDYLQWIFGPLATVKSCGGHISKLEIETEDYVSLVGKTNRGVMETVSLDYLSRASIRRIYANADKITCFCDLVDGKLEVFSDSGVTIHRPELGFERNSTYAAMHTNILEGEGSVACSLEEGLALLEVIERIRENMKESIP